MYVHVGTRGVASHEDDDESPQASSRKHIEMQQNRCRTDVFLIGVSTKFAQSPQASKNPGYAPDP